MVHSHNNDEVDTAPDSALDIQIIAIESYTVSPTSADCVLNKPFNISETPLPVVPTIRIFGATRSGQRICLHVHRVWPYMYVRYTGSSNLQSVRKFGYQLGLSLNSALNLSLGGCDSVYVAAVIPVKGVPFYGYSLGHQPFLKIQFASASVVSRASSLLASGAVMGQKFELFESHLPHTLQFLIDYNLYGMDWLSLASVRFRNPLPAANNENTMSAINDTNVPLQSRWIPSGVPSYLVNPPPPGRESTCELEADALAMDIINRQKVQERSIHHRLFEREEVMHSGRLVPSLDVIWTDENWRRSKNGIQKLYPASRSKSALTKNSTDTQSTRQWSNHWQMQSMFESVLAEDLRLSKQNMSCELYNSWLERWPSCYQIDLPGLSLFGLNKDEHFYLSSDVNEPCIPAHKSAQTPVTIDIDLAAQAMPKTSGTNQADRMSISSSPNFGHSDEIDMDLCNDLLEYGNVFSDSTRLTTNMDKFGQDVTSGIPQIDGADDRKRKRGSSKQCRHGNRGKWKSQTNMHVSGKSARRMWLPLDLRPAARIGDQSGSSYGQTPLKANKEHSASSDKCQHQRTKNTAAIVLSKRADKPDIEIEALSFGRAKRVRKGNFDVFVDIPHPEGSICNRRNVDTAKEPQKFYKYAESPPTAKHLLSTLEFHGILKEMAPGPWYSDVADVPRRSKLLSGALMQSLAQHNSSMKLFIPKYAMSSASGINVLDTERSHAACRERRDTMWNSAAIYASTSTSTARASAIGWSFGWWSFARQPPRPSYMKSARSANNSTVPVQRRQRDQSDLKWGSILGKLMQRESPVLPKQGNFSSTGNSSKQPSSDVNSSKIKVPASILSAEILASSRHQLLPDPRYDSILLIATCFSPDGQWKVDDHKYISILWTCEPREKLCRLGISDNIKQWSFANEAEMLVEFAQWVRKTDPDILCGYEVQKGSWGFIIERAVLAYGLQLDCSLSRLLRFPQPKNKPPLESWTYRKGAAIKIAGRHVLNIWRLLRNELNLTSYTFESTVAAVLGERSPHYTFAELAKWYQNGPVVAHIRVLRYVHYRAMAAMCILHKTDIVARTSEFASVIGIDFHSVITRGSQLRVESLMARIAHPEQFILASPTRQQVSQQRAAECLPLVLEPQSNYYTDPVVVLDFQSLYPSIMIAYNYCFSTCLGSLEDIAASASSDGGVERRLGFTHLNVPSGLLSILKDHITISPNGIMF
ncbi:DNA polymerase zeta, partial [Coemansia brasiliensis]